MASDDPRALGEADGIAFADRTALDALGTWPRPGWENAMMADLVMQFATGGSRLIAAGRPPSDAQAYAEGCLHGFRQRLAVIVAEETGRQGAAQ